MSGPTSVLMSYMSELFGAKRRDSVVMVVGLFQSIGGCLQPRKFTKTNQHHNYYTSFT